MLTGVVEGVTQKTISYAITSQLNSLKIKNIILKRHHKDGKLSGEARLLFETEKDVKRVRAILPIKTHPIFNENTSRCDPRLHRTVLLTEKKLKFGKRKLLEIERLKKQGLVNVNLKELERQNSPPPPTNHSKVDRQKLSSYPNESRSNKNNELGNRRHQPFSPNKVKHWEEPFKNHSLHKNN